MTKKTVNSPSALLLLQQDIPHVVDLQYVVVLAYLWMVHAEIDVKEADWMPFVYRNTIMCVSKLCTKSPDYLLQSTSSCSLLDILVVCVYLPLPRSRLVVRDSPLCESVCVSFVFFSIFPCPVYSNI